MSIKRIIVPKYAKLLFALFLIFLNISCDQLTKNTVRKSLPAHEQVNVVGNNFILIKVENTGAALSFGENFPPFLKIIVFQILPFIALIVLFIYLLKYKNIDLFNFIAGCFIIGGGIGNIIDRFLYHSVTDFMYIEFGSLHTGIFNMADVSVTFGVIVLVLNSLITRKKLLIA